MPTVIDHTHDFKSGTRVLSLVGRLKDGVSNQRGVNRVTHNESQWETAFSAFLANMQEGQRIYCTAGSRDVAKASRLFKERQLAAEYDEDPLNFYRALEARWASALTSPSSQLQKVWMFDCDTDAEIKVVEVEAAARGIPVTWYKTKNGRHGLVAPFNKMLVSEQVRSLIHMNALGLLAY